MFHEDETNAGPRRIEKARTRGGAALLRLAEILGSDAAFEAGLLLLFGLVGMLVSAQIILGDAGQMILFALSR